jgi:hypothetical protein
VRLEEVLYHRLGLLEVSLDLLLVPQVVDDG